MLNLVTAEAVAHVVHERPVANSRPHVSMVGVFSAASLAFGPVECRLLSTDGLHQIKFVTPPPRERGVTSPFRLASQGGPLEV